MAKKTHKKKAEQTANNEDQAIKDQVLENLKNMTQAEQNPIGTISGQMTYTPEKPMWGKAKQSRNHLK
jgi:hypothetical protein